MSASNGGDPRRASAQRSPRPSLMRVAGRCSRATSEHLRALVDADDGAALLAEHALDATAPGAGRDVETPRRLGLASTARDEDICANAGPARAKAAGRSARRWGRAGAKELERARAFGRGGCLGHGRLRRRLRCRPEAVAALPTRPSTPADGELADRVLTARGAYSRRVALAQDLRRVAEAAVRYAGPGEEVVGIVPAEAIWGLAPTSAPTAARTARRAGSWLDEDGKPVKDRVRIREVVSIAALVELAEETAGGGDLEELRSQLVALRLLENPAGNRRGRRGRARARERRSVRLRAWRRRTDSTPSARRRSGSSGSLGGEGSPLCGCDDAGDGDGRELTRDVEAASRSRSTGDSRWPTVVSWKAAHPVSRSAAIRRT